MTYDDAKFNADAMATIIGHNLMTGGNAKTLYNTCEPEVQALIRCQLTHSQKRALGLLEACEPDHFELALRARMREREEAQFGKKYDVSKRLRTAQAKMYYDLIKVA